MADLTVTATSVVTYSGAATDSGTAGEAITAGMTLYRHTDGKLYKALDDTAAHAACIGVALNGGAANQPISYVKSGGYHPGATVAIGAVYGVTNLAGGVGAISERQAEEFLTLLGVATTTTRIELTINRSGVAIA